MTALAAVSCIVVLYEPSMTRCYSALCACLPVHVSLFFYCLPVQLITQQACDW